MRHILGFALILVSVLVGCSASNGVGTPSTHKSNTVDTSQLVDVPVTDVTNVFAPPSEFVHKPGHRLISTANAFEGYFGSPAPASIDFDDTWVVFAATGAKTSGGYHASVRVSLNESGRSISARVVTSTPGSGCATTSAIMFPYFIGTIPAGAGRGILPQSIRYYDRVTAQPACGAVCGEALLATLANAAKYEGEDVLATSEADYPYTPVHLGVAPETLDVASVAKAALQSGALDTFIQEQELPPDKDQLLALLLDDRQAGNEDWEAFSSDVGPFEDWRQQVGGYDEDMSEWDDYTRASNMGHRQLADALSRHLTDVRLYYLFDIEVQLLIVGRSPCGEIVGYHTILIWT